MDPGALGSLGVGTGFAMAAKLAQPEEGSALLLRRRLVRHDRLRHGDGQPLWRRRIIAVVGNNSAMNQIRYGQIAKYGPQRGNVGNKLGDMSSRSSPQMLGGYGEEVREAAKIGPALKRAREAVAKTGKSAP